jgi:hypothetical protein
MSSFVRKEAVEFIVKVGSRATLQFTVQDDLGAVKNLSDTVVYNKAVFKCWKTDGTIVISGNAIFEDRVNGVIGYPLTETDTVAANAGVWKGEVELFNDSNVMVEQVEDFTVTIKNSY